MGDRRIRRICQGHLFHPRIHRRPRPRIRLHIHPRICHHPCPHRNAPSRVLPPPPNPNYLLLYHFRPRSHLPIVFFLRYPTRALSFPPSLACRFSAFFPSLFPFSDPFLAFYHVSFLPPSVPSSPYRHLPSSLFPCAVNIFLRRRICDNRHRRSWNRIFSSHPRSPDPATDCSPGSDPPIHIPGNCIWDSPRSHRWFSSCTMACCISDSTPFPD